MFVTNAPDSDDYFPDDDFFPDVNNLLDDMAGEDTKPKTSAYVAAAVPYVFFLFLLDVLPKFLVLASTLDTFGYSSYLQMLFTFSLSDCMTCFISVILVMLYLVFLLIKLFGKLLIFPTRLVSSGLRTMAAWWIPALASRRALSFLRILLGFMSCSERRDVGASLKME